MKRIIGYLFLTLLYITIGFSQSNVKLYEGVIFAPAPIVVSSGPSQLNIWGQYAVYNYGASSVLIDQFTLAILKGGVHQFDLASTYNITVPGGSYYNYPRAYGYVTTTGSFTAVARYKISGTWYDIPIGQVGAVNPYSFQVVPPAPTLTWPPNGQTILNDLTPDLAWNTVQDANYFWVQVDNNSNFSSPEAENTMVWTLNWTPSMSTYGTYYWRAKAHTTTNVWSEWSSTWSFTLATCSYSISPTNASYGSSGGTGSVSVTSPSGCAWTATSNASWITITSGSSGSGNGSVGYSVSSNSSSSPRSGSMTIAGYTFTVNQSGVSCSYSLVPTSASYNSSGGTGSVSVTSPSGCAWTAVSNDSWITITSGSSGSDNGSVGYSVSSNSSSSPRSGSMTIAGYSFTVNQTGVSCTYSLSQTNASYNSSGGTGSVSVITPSGCAWTAVSNDAWITITSGSSGNGNGSVGYSVSSNSSSSPRSGTMTIAGNTFTVNQSGVNCTYSLNPTSASYNSSGGTSSVSVTTPSGCTWIAVSNDGWITITSGSSGSGNGSVGYSISANSSSSPRSGTMTIAGDIFTVNQTGVNLRTPIIFIPGIMGSPLYNDVDHDGTLELLERIWMSKLQVYLDKEYGEGKSLYLDVLQLKPDGINPNDASYDIKPSPAQNDNGQTIDEELENINFPLSIYRDLIYDLKDQLGYKVDNFDNYHDQGEDLFCFTYDWRKDITWTSEQLYNLINNVKTWTHSSKVSIIAHSMGGLIAKKCIQSYGNSDIQKIIFVGTPHGGAPKAYYVALQGDLQGIMGFCFNSEEIKKIGRNFPTTYQLFPSRTYYNMAFLPIWYEPGNRLLNYDQADAYLRGQGLNSGLIDVASAFRESIDNVDFGDIQVYNIVGHLIPTIGRIDHKYSGIEIDPHWGILGDGTVPSISAAYINHSRKVDLWVYNVDHSNLCSDPIVRGWIRQTLGTPSFTGLHIADNVQVDTVETFVASNYTIKVDHEVILNVYDSLGRHTGPTSDSTWEANIPGSEYIPGDVRQANSLKVIILPREGKYHFAIESQDTTSHFNISIDDIVDGNLISSLNYDSIPTLPNTIVRSEFQSIPPDLDVVVDRNGDSTELVVTKPNTVQVSTIAQKRWNMLSIPITAFDSSKATVFPSAISNAFWYKPGMSYQSEDTIHRCIGYWLKFDSSEVISFYGVPRFSDTIMVQEGWNLIGTISKLLVASSVTSEPPGLITSQFFGYNSGYKFADTLYPGKGYWIKVNQSGLLILSSSSTVLAKSSASRIRIVATAELPPPPPDGNSTTIEIPRQFVLEQNYPNPFNPVTVFRYQLPIASKVTFKIYNLLGQEIKTLVDDWQDAGFKKVEWDASNFSSGVYFYRIHAGTFIQTKKLILMR